MLCTMCCTIYVVHSLLYTLCCNIYVVHSVLYTLCWTINVVHPMLLAVYCALVDSDSTTELVQQFIFVQSPHLIPTSFLPRLPFPVLFYLPTCLSLPPQYTSISCHRFPQANHKLEGCTCCIALHCTISEVKLQIQYLYSAFTVHIQCTV